MKTIFHILLAACFAPLFHVAAAEPAAISLEELLNIHQEHSGESRATAPLKPEWIGEIKRTHVMGDTEGIYQEAEPPRPLRLNFASIEASAGPKSPKASVVVVQAARRTKDGALSYLGSDRAVYRETLPTADEIAKTTAVAQLEQWFGPQHGWTDGWGGPDGMHWTEGWTFVTPVKSGQLRYLSIFAHVHGRKGKPAQVDIMTIHQADLRPADPASAEEARLFPSAEELNRREVIARNAEIQKFPLPLRDLIAADEAPDDSDMVTMIAYINRFREHPDSLLISQLLAHTHEDTVRYGMMLEALLLDHGHPKAKPWNPAKQRQTIGLLIDALPDTQDDEALFQTCVIALKELGDGKLKLKAGDAEIDLVVSLGKTSQSVTGSHADHDPALIRLIQQKLRKRLE